MWHCWRKSQRKCLCLRSENHIPGWSILPCAADDSLCREGGRIAVDLCNRSQAPVTAGLAHTTGFARTAFIRGAAADPSAIRIDRRLGRGHFRSRRYLGSKASGGIPRLQERLIFLRAPINTLQVFLQRWKTLEERGNPRTRPLPRRAHFLTKRSTGTRNFASGFFTTVLFLFFLLPTGDVFLHRLVEILPRFKSKRQVVEISQQIERDTSAYLVTITILERGGGNCYGIGDVAHGGGRPDPLGDGGLSG